MLTIMDLKPNAEGRHDIQAQSHRTACWLEGWVAVPEELVPTLLECGGWCEPVLTDGVLTGLTPKERPPMPEPAPTEAEQLRADVDYLAAMGGVTL